MNRWLAILLLVIASVGAFHAGGYLEREAMQQRCATLQMFAVGERVWLCEERAAVRVRLEAERRKVNLLERKDGSP